MLCESFDPTPNAHMPAAITLCKAGTGGSLCANCTKGSYSTGGTLADPGKTCTPCGTGKTTLGTGSVNATFCGEPRHGLR